MKLEEIGFYTLSDCRARKTSWLSPLWRCELLLTSRCNLSCPYCRGIKLEDQGDISWKEAKYTVDLWASESLKNIRFSGGEPTLWPYLVELIEYTRPKVERIALSTNGAAASDLYRRLYSAGVNDFSVSLDACCSITGKRMSGEEKLWARVVSNIRLLASMTYTTVGVVTTGTNVREIEGIIQLATSLGVHDVRIIPAAQEGRFLPKISALDFSGFPILQYRISNLAEGKSIRGKRPTDNPWCPLVLDDMAVLNGKHYPCIIYLREQGQPIGEIGPLMRHQRLQWVQDTDTSKDPICEKNCLDVCVEYNNKVERFRRENHDS